MNNRVHVLASRQLMNDRNYLNPEPLGVSLNELDLDKDDKFRKLELARREAKQNQSKAVADAENNNNNKDKDKNNCEAANQAAAVILQL